jgi:hypothetical protein
MPISQTAVRRPVATGKVFGKLCKIEIASSLRASQ